MNRSIDIMERIGNILNWNKLFRNAITIFLAVVFSFFLAFLIWLETEMSLISSIYTAFLKDLG